MEESKAKFESLCMLMKETLYKKTEHMTMSKRLASSSCCSVISSYAWSSSMKQIMKTQWLQEKDTTGYIVAKRDIEINSYNSILDILWQKIEGLKYR